MNKELLFRQCMAFIDSRIQNFQSAIEQAQQASVDDTKSSAGDKYETTREMMKQEIDRNQKQLIEANQQRIFLKSLANLSPSNVARNGSLVHTSNGHFFLSISAGELKVMEERIYAISQVSPIGKLLMGKKLGDSFEFNGKPYVVLGII